MSHIDQDTLEQFVVNALAIQSDRARIIRHLEQCPRCRAVAREFSRYYADAERHIQTRLPESVCRYGTGAGRDLRALRTAGSKTVTALDAGRLSTRDLPGGLFAFCQRHQAITAGGMLLVAALMMVTFLKVPQLWTSSNPSYVHYNLATQYIEVYDRFDRLLWQKPARSLESALAQETNRKSPLTIVEDIDGDGKNEVITLAQMELEAEGTITDMLRVFGAGGHETLRLRLGEAINFGGRSYDGQRYGGTGLTVIHGPGGTELYVSLANFRSPSVIIRLDARGAVLGQYWHYGHILALWRMRAPGENGERLVFPAVNDARDSAGVRFGVVGVLLPPRIQGRTECSVTRGFGYQASAAEVIYMRFLGCDMDQAAGTLPVIVDRLASEESGARLLLGSQDSGATRFGFEFDFDRTWKLQEVRSIDGNERVHAALKHAGQISSSWSRGYVSSLRESLEYWTGSLWVKEYRSIQ